MNSKPKVAVLAGGGRTGNFVMRALLKQNYRLKLLLRKPEKFDIQSDLIEIVKGDALDPEAVHSLLQGCQAVFSTIGQRKDEPLVASRATINILDAMHKFQIRRYISVAGINIDTPFDKKSQQTILATEWMSANFPSIHEDRQKAYSLLAASQVDWTLVRVPFIEFAEACGEIKVSLEDCLGTKINAGDIAEFMVRQLSDDKYVRQAPFIANA